MGNGGVHLHRFQRLIAALLLGPGVAGAHIVQPVAQFDDHNADILAHRQQHLAQVFCLTILHVGEFDLGQLGDAVHQQGNFIAEFLTDLGNAHRGVLRHIVHQGGGNALAVHTQLHQDLRDAQRVADIRLAAAAALVAVRLGCQRVGAVDHIEIISAPAVQKILFQIRIGDGHFDFAVFH